MSCAFSGGADSSALVALAVSAGLDVTAHHVNHRSRPESDDEAIAAEQIAARLGAAFVSSVAPVASGPNFEARARAARRSVLGPDVLTGHTADDQAETLLLALLRGSGATGLSAMATGPTHPLLGLRRHETHALCAAFEIDPVDDPSNADPRFRRNRVRHEVMPLLDEIAERDVVALATRSADLLGADDRLLNELAAAIDATDAIALSGAPLPLARRAVRSWLSVDGYPPDAAAIARVLDVAAGRSGACEVAGIGRIRRSRQRLLIESDRTPATRFP